MKKPNSSFEIVPLAEVREKTLGVGNETVGERLNGGRTSKAKRVLVVDDEQVIADTLGTILRNSGYEAAVAYDAQSALRQCDMLNPQLIIADVIMPGMDGIEMAMLIRDRHPDCKILLISGQASTTNLLEKSRQRGYNFELLAKPIYPEDLLSRVTVLTSRTDRNSAGQVPAPGH